MAHRYGVAVWGLSGVILQLFNEAVVRSCDGDVEIVVNKLQGRRSRPCCYVIHWYGCNAVMCNKPTAYYVVPKRAIRAGHEQHSFAGYVLDTFCKSSCCEFGNLSDGEGGRRYVRS